MSDARKRMRINHEEPKSGTIWQIVPLFGSSWLILEGEHMRSRTIGRALALTIAITLAAAAPFISIAASATQNDNESSWEEKFRAIPQADSIKERMRALSAEPHHVGSAADKRNAEWIRDQMKSWGLDATIEEFDVLFPTPKERVLELTEPEKYQAKLKEPAIPEDPDSGDENQ